MLDLVAEHARMEERNAIKNRLKEVLVGTKYEHRTQEIIEFVATNKGSGRKSLYTGSLHYFGRNDGAAIYQIVKQVV